jgi:hypothetical protein
MKLLDAKGDRTHAQIYFKDLGLEHDTTQLSKPSLDEMKASMPISKRGGLERARIRRRKDYRDKIVKDNEENTEKVSGLESCG